MAKPRVLSVSLRTNLYAETSALIAELIMSVLLEKSPSAVKVSLMVIMLVLLCKLLYTLRYCMRVKSAVKVIEDCIKDVEDGKIEFSSPIVARPVICELGAARKTRFTKKTLLTPQGEFTCSTSFTISSDECCVIYTSTLYFLHLPGLELEDHKLKGIILLYIPSRQPLFKEASFTLMSRRGGLISITIYRHFGLFGKAMLIGEPEAVVYLAVKIGKARAKFRLTKLRDGECKTFSLQLAPERPTIIVLHRSMLSTPLLILHTIGKPGILYTTKINDNMHYMLLVEFRRGKFRREVISVDLSAASS